MGWKKLSWLRYLEHNQKLVSVFLTGSESGVKYKIIDVDNFGITFEKEGNKMFIPHHRIKEIDNVEEWWYWEN